jgi:large subunit ribosomal protein L24
MSKERYTPKVKFKKGDKVIVITGSYKGTQGDILEIFPAKNSAIVDGVNIQKKHQKPTNDQAGGINEISAPIHLSNIMLVDPKSGEATKVGRKMDNDKLVRYSKKSGEIIR